MIIALTGLCIAPRRWWQLRPRMGSAGAGKSTVANRLVKVHGFVEMGLADPMKHFLCDLFDWSPEVLWGPTELKNRGDPRYPRPDGPLLSPRTAMIDLATGWGRKCYPTIWVEYAVRKARETGRVVISDVRFRNEVDVLRKAGALLGGGRRPVKELFVKTTHPSEVELNWMLDSAFDYVIHGPPEGVPELEELTGRMMKELGQ